MIRAQKSLLFDDLVVVTSLVNVGVSQDSGLNICSEVQSEI